MKVADNRIEENIDFKGLWDLPSRCGLQRIEKEGKHIVIVTELYQDNPGSSITSVSASLAMQIAERYHFNVKDMIYIERSPDMHSKLSFYDEIQYHVSFVNDQGILTRPEWRKLSQEEFITLLK